MSFSTRAPELEFVRNDVREYRRNQLVEIGEQIEANLKVGENIYKSTSGIQEAGERDGSEVESGEEVSGDEESGRNVRTSRDVLEKQDKRNEVDARSVQLLEEAWNRMVGVRPVRFSSNHDGGVDDGADAGLGIDLFGKKDKKTGKKGSSKKESAGMGKRRKSVKGTKRGRRS